MLLLAPFCYQLWGLMYFFWAEEAGKSTSPNCGWNRTGSKFATYQTSSHFGVSSNHLLPMYRDILNYSSNSED